MSMKTTFRQLFEAEKCVLAPEIYDCVSAQTVEECGFKAAVISGAELARSMLGVPDLGLLNFEEVHWAASRICSFSSLPIVVDAENGYGPAINTYRNCERLAVAGAGGIIIVDSPEPRIGGTLPVSEAIMKYRAAHDALMGSDCILVARTDALDLDEAIYRSNKYLEAGADMTLIFMINNIEPERRLDVCKKISDKVPGWKWYPDLGAHNGKSDVEMEEVAELGFNLIGVHYLLSAALWAMLDAGKHNFKNKNGVYSTEKYPISALGTPDMLRKWMDFESKYVEDTDSLEDKWPYSIMNRKT